jgi:hypothetical protein
VLWSAVAVDAAISAHDRWLWLALRSALVVGVRGRRFD